MQHKKFALIGKGGHASEVEQFLPFQVEKFDHLEFLANDVLQYEVMIAVGDSALRKKIYDALPRYISYFSYIHPSAFVGRNVIIGDGSFVGPNCVLTTNIFIGNHALLLRGCHVGHDCNIGNFLSMMGNSVVNGNCTLGHQVYVGTNASVREKTVISNNVKVGMNSAVVKNIINPGVYAGCPASQVR